MISLDARASSSLDWDFSVLEGEKIFWRLDFGLEDPNFPMDDEMHLQALKLATQKFVKEIYPKYEEISRGVIFYMGSLDFSKDFVWSEKQLLGFSEWKENQPMASEDLLKKFYCRDVFVHYFQLLSYEIPEDLPIYLFFDADYVGGLAEKHHILSKERFEFFEIAVRNLPHFGGPFWEGECEPVQKSLIHDAICFPEDAYLDGKVLEKLDQKMSSFNNPLRVVKETFLTEDWLEIDRLHVIENSLSPRGERKLTGFKVAGGEVTIHS